MKLVTKIQNYRFIFFLSVNQKNEYHIKISKKGGPLNCFVTRSLNITSGGGTHTCS